MMESSIEKLKRLTDKIVGYEILRRENLKRIKELFFSLGIDKKIETVSELFEFKAMNLGGISLSEENFAQIKEGRYVQIIAIVKENERMKNVNLAYFGRSEKLMEDRKYEIIEFVLRWRLEKSFKNVEHYKELIEKVPKIEKR